MKKTTAIIAALLMVIAGLTYALYRGRNSVLNSKLQPVHAAASEIRGALDVGASYAAYGQRLQALSSAIILAKEAGASSTDLERYSTALDDYRDALTLWGDKIEHPYLYGLGTYVLGDYNPLLDTMAEKYGVPGKSSRDAREDLRVYGAVTQEIWTRASKILDKARQPK
jgi:hypothetical protein